MPIFDYNRIYQAYSGCDMVCHINHIPVGTLQALTVSITREVVPVYTMGSADVKTFVKGKRGIAGSLSFSTFDRHALLMDIFRDKGSNLETGYWYNRKTLKELVDLGQSYVTNGLGQSQSVDRKLGTQPTSTDQDVKSVIDAFGEKKLRYSDELPPFNITLTMVNDYGAASSCHINGVVLINEGYGYSMDDLTNEIAFTYVAREVAPLTALSTGMFQTV